MIHISCEEEKHSYEPDPKDRRGSSPFLMVAGGVRALPTTAKDVAGCVIEPEDRVNLYKLWGLKKVCYHEHCGMAKLLYGDFRAIKEIYEGRLAVVGAQEYHLDGVHQATRVAVYRGGRLGDTEVICTDDRFEPNKNPLSGELEFGLHLGKFDQLLDNMKRDLGAEPWRVHRAANRFIEVAEYAYKALVPGFGSKDMDQMRLEHERFVFGFKSG